MLSDKISCMHVVWCLCIILNFVTDRRKSVNINNDAY